MIASILASKPHAAPKQAEPPSDSRAATISEIAARALFAFEMVGPLASVAAIVAGFPSVGVPLYVLSGACNVGSCVIHKLNRPSTNTEQNS